MASEETAAASYRQPLRQVLRALGTDARNGLGKDEARARLRRHGPNELAPEKRIPAWRKLLAQFKDVLVILLLIATVISTVIRVTAFKLGAAAGAATAASTGTGLGTAEAVEALLPQVEIEALA